MHKKAKPSFAVLSVRVPPTHAAPTQFVETLDTTGTEHATETDDHGNTSAPITHPVKPTRWKILLRKLAGSQG